MGPGRTIVIKGEVNTSAKGSVSLSDLKSADAAVVSLTLSQQARELQVGPAP